ncbi:hypothetical protein SCP_0501170 [Sparassis crispa]|uniref:Uncharacterized protein n=1 Tax=Sparassis crispa TaxID=139825 RepID=A0A401GLK5_9APHY|nr:hypothetical protein SCP_0501170 [Sparassis crispa]GBE83071.1 hypothetical protein SCP_0501170 [Sparassis crispa]
MRNIKVSPGLAFELKDTKRRLRASVTYTSRSEGLTRTGSTEATPWSAWPLYRRCYAEVVTNSKHRPPSIS